MCPMVSGLRSRRQGNDVLVLCYHAISEEWPADLSTTPARLRAQLESLVSRGYHGATFTEAITGPAVSGKTLVVSFDDAYRSVLELAAPILAELGLPGTVFVPTSFASSDEPMTWPGIDHWLGTPYAGELRPMSWSQLAEIAAGGWEVGSHTRTHPRLTELDDERLERELSGSRADAEAALGRACTSLAFPYGDHDERVVRATERAGYAAAATLPVRWHPSSPLRWPRVGVYHRDDLRRFRLKVSPRLLQLRATRWWDSLHALRSRR